MDLESQEVIVHAPQEMHYGFDIGNGNKEQLLNGLDDIDLTLKHESLISDFEKGHSIYIHS